MKRKHENERLTFAKKKTVRRLLDKSVKNKQKK